MAHHRLELPLEVGLEDARPVHGGGEVEAGYVPAVDLQVVWVHLQISKVWEI